MDPVKKILGPKFTIVAGPDSYKKVQLELEVKSGLPSSDKIEYVYKQLDYAFNVGTNAELKKWKNEARKILAKDFSKLVTKPGVFDSSRETMEKRRQKFWYNKLDELYSNI